MAPSKPPKDVLGLGRHLVRELGLEEGVDTLGRWMAHHLAELIDEAENSPTEAERLKAKEYATETILKIWERRSSLPGKAYPLKSFHNVLLVMDKLRPDNNPFRYFGHNDDAKRDQYAVDLFDGFSRLIVILLLTKIPSREISEEVDSVVMDALSETEQYLLSTLQQWSKLFTSTDENLGQKRKHKKDNDPINVNLDEAAIRLIDSLMSSLVELRNELQGVQH